MCHLETSGVFKTCVKRSETGACRAELVGARLQNLARRQVRDLFALGFFVNILSL